MNIDWEFLSLILKRNVLESLGIIVIAIVLLKLSKKFFNKNIELIDKKYDKDDNKNKTYVNLFSHIVKWVIIITAIIFILSINGVNVTSGLASLGIVSVIVGLALQDALKDLIMGFNIISDRYYTIGDTIKIGEIEGKIIDFNLKVTKIKDIHTGNTLTICNRNISQALVISTQLDIDIPLRYEESVEEIEKVIDEIMVLAKENKNVKSIQYMGINEFGESAIYYKIRMKVIPELKPSVKRYVNRIIKLKLEEHNLEVPYTQIQIHGLEEKEKILK